MSERRKLQGFFYLSFYIYIWEKSFHIVHVYKNIYFEGDTKGGQISYDYKIKKGIVKNTNGIKLLEYLGLYV